MNASCGDKLHCLKCGVMRYHHSGDDFRDHSFTFDPPSFLDGDVLSMIMEGMDVEYDHPRYWPGATLRVRLKDGNWNNWELVLRMGERPTLRWRGRP